jgi:hypothetical protein
MAKEKISVTVDATVLAATDADARAAGLNRSEMIEQALRNEHLRVALQKHDPNRPGARHRRLRAEGLPGEPVRGLVITPGDIAPRRDSDDELYVAVLSNAIHLAADTGRVIACPFIPGRLRTTPWRWSSLSSNPKARFYPNSCSGFLALRSTNQSAPSAQPPSARPRRW